jgi:uncharacterized membrane protein
MRRKQSWFARLLGGQQWTITAVLCLAGFVLGLVLVRVDQGLRLKPSPDRVWLYGGDASGAIGVLSAIASSAITVAGVIFSANFVAMQLASSQYTPRVIRSLARKRRLQVVLGVFVASFAFSLVVMRSVRSATADTPEFVPVLSVSFAVSLALASVGVLVFYVYYGVRSVQPDFLITSAAAESLRLMQTDAVETANGGGARQTYPGPIDEPAAGVTAAGWGYIQRVDSDALLRLAKERNLLIRLDRLVGDYVLPGEQLATVWPAVACDAEVTSVIRLGYVIGDERTPEQDVEYGFQRVQDIALKALSPAINDPTTARWCIDRLGEMLILLATHPVAPYGLPGGPEGVGILWDDRQFERCVDIAFAQMRHYGATDAVVMAHLLTMQRRIAALVPPTHRDVVVAEAWRARRQAAAAATLPDERARIDAAAAWLDKEEASESTPFLVQQVG